MATTKKKKEKKMYHELNADELNRELEKVQQDLYKIRFRAASAPVANPNQIGSLRKEVARIKTFISQRSQKA